MGGGVGEEEAACTELTPEDAERLAEVMQALASPTRLRVLSMLRAGPLTVTDLCRDLSVSQATISNHLRLMRHLDLVAGNREGRNVHYRLYDDHVADLLDQAIGHIAHAPSLGRRGTAEPGGRST